MKITNCRINRIKNPIGYQLGRTVFSFVAEEAAGKRQAAARIRVAEDAGMERLLYDSGMTEQVDSLGTELRLDLAPRTRYFWDAAVRSDAGEEAVSEVSFFETGKLDEPWAGKLISCDRSERRHPVFTKEFHLETAKEIRSARLYITGLGLYRASINGRPVTEERLTPYYTDYNKWVQYQTYDVAGLLGQKNKIEVTLGNGWYSGRFNFMSKPGSAGYYGDDWKLLAELRVQYGDGTETVVGSDETWEVMRSNIIFSNIYDGEQRDDTLPPTEPEKAIVLDEMLPAKERLSLPVLIHEELPAKELLLTPAGEQVFDLGQNMTGGWRLRVHEPEGARIHVQVGEVLQEGNFYRDNLRTARAEYIYVSDGQEHVLEPQFTFYGYRYAKVAGCSHLTKEDFTGLAYYSDVTPAGSLTTGDEKLNRLLSNIQWGQKSNFVDIPTDCPQRDERMGWTADTQVFVPTANYFTDSFAFYRRYLYELRMEQGADGCVPDVVPRTGVDGGCSVWGDAATIIPWKLYEFYGDKSILAESWGSMKAWVDYITSVDGNDHGWERVFHYGDWLALDHPAGGADMCQGGTDEGFIAEVYYMYSASLVKKAAALLGMAEDAEKYAALEEKIRNYILDEYFTPNGRLAVTTQTGYTLALYYGLVGSAVADGEKLPEGATVDEKKRPTGAMADGKEQPTDASADGDELTAGAAAGREVLSADRGNRHTDDAALPSGATDKLKELLLKSLKDSNWKLKTGFVGTPLILKVLSGLGEDKVAYRLLHNEEYPGWLYEVGMGATTVWERWNSMEPDGKVSSTGMNSFNHYAYGAVGEWMWRTIGGIAPDEAVPGFRRAILRPTPDYKTGKCEAAFHSASGLWKVSWEVLGADRVELHVSVPFHCTAVLLLPCAADLPERIKLDAGEYTFCYTTKEPLKKRYSSESTFEELFADEDVKAKLAQLVPGISQVPHGMMGMRLKDLVSGYMPDGGGLLEQIDRVLAE